MSEKLTLKSKLLRAGDPWSVDLSQFTPRLQADEGRYRRDLENLLRRFAVTEEAGEVGVHDTVTVTCTSENPRFNREHVSFRAGLGLFSKELENALLGWPVGKTGEVTVAGQTVTVTVEAVRRERLPEPDDALAARCGMAFIRTGADILTCCRGKQFEEDLEEAADEAYPALANGIINASAFELDDGEVAFANELTQKNLHIPEELDEETARMIRESMANAGVFSLQCALLGLADLERCGKAPTREDYEAYLTRFIDRGETPEAAREAHPPLEYLLNEIGGNYMDGLELLALQRLKEGVTL